MTSLMWIGVVIGLALGLGVVLCLEYLHRRSIPQLVQRVEPQLKTFEPEQRVYSEQQHSRHGAITVVLRPLVDSITERFSRLNLGNAQLHSRIQRAGLSLSVTDYRIQQILLGVAGGILGMLLSMGLALNGYFNPIIGLLLVAGLAIIGFFYRDNLLSAKIKKRRTAVLAEFPTVAELMALSVAAGETALGAIERVARTARGELSDEFRTVVTEVRAGATLKRALTESSKRLQITPIERFNTGILVALERGTPLADVMRAQAHDVKELSKRELMELAGKKEISMMLPLVFGLLPLTVIFAALPGLSLLNFGI